MEPELNRLKGYPEKYYTKQDSVLLVQLNENSVYASKNEFNEVVKKHPEFFVDFPQSPDITYSLSSSLDNFGSEIGQDYYYLYYTYFLNQRYINKDYSNERRKLMLIYSCLNEIFSLLDGGGTGYAHLYARIYGYVEYSVYVYDQNDFTKEPLDIVNGKQLFKEDLFRMVNNRLLDNREYFKEEKLKIQTEIKSLIEKIDSEITEIFYLDEVQKFYNSTYKTD